MTTPFTISTLPIGNGLLALCPLPGRSGTLDSDLDTIRQCGVALILSLTEAEELRRLEMSGLHPALEARGFTWRGFPIPDFGIPTRDQDWAPLSREARTVFENGGTVLVHCHGGLGRSGMIALRLMVEHGEDPSAALDRLRMARPGAVETEEQRLWAVGAIP